MFDWLARPLGGPPKPRRPRGRVTPSPAGLVSVAFGGPLLPPFCGLTRRSLANNLGRPRRFLPAARFGPALGGTERGASLLARAVESEPMPRDGAITLTDLQAPFLRVVCEPCGPRRPLRRGAADSGGRRRKADRSPFPTSPTARGRRIPPRASMTAARPGSRRLFRTAARFFRQTNDDVAVGLAWAAHLAERSTNLRSSQRF